MVVQRLSHCNWPSFLWVSVNHLISMEDAVLPLVIMPNWLHRPVVSPYNYWQLFG